MLLVCVLELPLNINVRQSRVKSRARLDSNCRQRPTNQHFEHATVMPDSHRLDTIRHRKGGRVAECTGLENSLPQRR